MAITPKRIEHLTPDERAARGRQARTSAPRRSHGAWEPAPDRRSPVAILQEQAASRVQELVPIRHARMTASPFAFYRGAAAVMAADLAATPSSGIRVQCCGDAHLANFGGFAAPDRMIVFDLNDFDETLPGPWEWDVKRLLASFEIAARAREFDRKTRSRIVEGTARAYRSAMVGNAARGNLDLWYARLDETSVHQVWDTRLGPEALRRFEKNLAKSRGKDSLRALSKLTTSVDGKHRIVSDPPLIVPLEDLLPVEVAARTRSTLQAWLRGYRQSLQPDRRHLLESYELVDVARKVVGVGSVGTRCWIAYLQGRDDGDPLFLQIKEAEASVLEPYVGKSTYENHGRRVVEGQRLTQAASDIFLGWDRAPDLAGDEHDFYAAPALGRQAVGPDRPDGARDPRGVRRDLRVDSGSGARPLRRRHRDRRVPRDEAGVRPGGDRVRVGLRRAEPAGLRGGRGRDRRGRAPRGSQRDAGMTAPRRHPGSALRRRG